MCSRTILFYCTILGGLGAALANGDDDGRFVTIDNSPGLTEILSLNSAEQMIGRKEIIDPGIGFETVSFYRDGDTEKSVPPIKGFTNIETQAINANGLVVGYATRPIQAGRGNVIGFVWHTDGVPKRLSTPQSYRSAYAYDVSDDGRTIAGYAVGAQPPRMTPCIWEANGDGWRCRLLETIEKHNPILSLSQVRLSADGRYVVASLNRKEISGNQAGWLVETFRWTKSDTKWRREKLFDGAMRIADVTDDGLLAGSVKRQRHWRAAVYDSDGVLHIIPLPAGHVKSQARGLNAAGDVVGLSDGPAGSDVYPRPFHWRDGKLIKIAVPAGFIPAAATAINDRGTIAGYGVHARNAKDQQTEESSVLFLLSTPSPSP